MYLFLWNSSRTELEQWFCGEQLKFWSVRTTELDQIRCWRVSYCSTITTCHIKLLRLWRKFLELVENCCHSLATVKTLCQVIYIYFGPLKESLDGLKFNDNQDVQQHMFWTSSASLTEISVPQASWRLVKRSERCVNLPRDILLKSDKNVFLLATVVSF